jgi:hypothetical protein
MILKVQINSLWTFADAHRYKHRRSRFQDGSIFLGNDVPNGWLLVAANPYPTLVA